MTIGPVPPLASNANAPQLCDYGRVAGFGLSLWVSVTGPTAAPGASYQYGTHAQAIYDAQARTSQLVPVANAPEGAGAPTALLTQPQYVEPSQAYLGKVPLATETVGFQPIRLTAAAPQVYDFTLQAWVTQPITPQGFVSSQYTYGTHAMEMYNSQAGGRVIPTATAAAQTRASRGLLGAPQAYDFTLQGFIPFVPVPTGWIVNMAASAPQDYDFTLQAWQTDAVPTPLIQGPRAPQPLYGAPQTDPTQIAAQVYKPPTKSIAGLSPRPIMARQEDPTQIAAQVFKSLPPGPGKSVQPARIFIPQQAYVDIPQPEINSPLVGTLPIFVSLTGQSFSFSTGAIIGQIIQLTGIYDYFTLAQALQDFSHRTDIANYQDYYIQQGETRIYRDLFAENIGNGVKWIETPFTGSISGGVVSVPPNYLALKSMQVVDAQNVFTLLYKDPQWIYSNYPMRQGGTTPAYVARDGANFVFGPFPSANFTLQGTYYGQSTALSAINPTTWMTSVCPDLLLAACMLELQPFLKDTNALATWQRIYAEKLTALVNLDQSERFAPGVMTMEVE